MRIFSDRFPELLQSARQRSRQGQEENGLLQEETRQLQKQWKRFNFPTQELLKLLLKDFGIRAAKIGTDAVIASRHGLHSVSDQDA